MMPRTLLHRIALVGLGVATLVLAFALPHQHDAFTPSRQCQVAQAGADVPVLVAERPAAPSPSLEAITPHAERLAAPFVVRLPASRAPPVLS